jgi:hypothetical protein
MDKIIFILNQTLKSENNFIDISIIYTLKEVLVCGTDYYEIIPSYYFLQGVEYSITH